VRPYLKKALPPRQKKEREGGRPGGVAQGVHPEFKPQYCKKKKKKKKVRVLATSHQHNGILVARDSKALITILQ
jgi:glutamine amidotransferase-like uncharacterized protein